MINFLNPLICLTIKEFSKTPIEAAYFNELVNLLTFIASVNKSAGFIPGETQKLREIKLAAIERGLIQFLFQIYKDEKVTPGAKEFIRDRLISHIHYADVDRSVNILNNILISKPNQEQQDIEDIEEEHVAEPSAPNSPGKSRNQEMDKLPGLKKETSTGTGNEQMKNLMSDELKGFVSKELAQQLTEFSEKIKQRVSNLQQKRLENKTKEQMEDGQKENVQKVRKPGLPKVPLKKTIETQ